MYSFEKRLAYTIYVKTDPKSFYVYVRSKSKTKTNVVPLRNGNGVLTSDELEISQILNSYISSVFTKEDLSENSPEAEQVFKGDLSLNLTDIVITLEMVVEK